MIFTIEEDGLAGDAECDCRKRFFRFDFENRLNVDVKEGRLFLSCPYCLTEQDVTGDIDAGEWDY
jgi:hypothetical protein